MLDLDTWGRSIQGQRLDLDGAPQRHPDQCHDVFLSYLLALGGRISDGHAPGTEYTDQVWRQFPQHRPGLAKLFTKHDASDVRRGDVVFWSAFAGVGGLPHVAVATGPPVNGYVPCITQNPNPVEYARLTLQGALGVLRPREEDEMTPEQADQLKAVYDALFKETPTSRGSSAGVLSVLAKLERIVNAIYDALFKETPTSRGTPAGVLGTLRLVCIKLGITTPDEPTKRD